MIETRGALEQCEALAAVDGLDGLFVGPGDLGLSLGLGPGQDREEAEIQDALARVLAACRKAGKRAAVHAGSVRYAARMAGAGFDLVTTWADTVAVASSLTAADELWAQQANRPAG